MKDNHDEHRQEAISSFWAGTFELPDRTPQFVWNLLREHVGHEFASTLAWAVRGMVDRMLMSAPKYGKITPETVAEKDWEATIRQRWEKYKETGNIEWLIDIMNCLCIMCTFPPRPQDHFRTTSSEESPGYIAADGPRRFHPQDIPARERQERQSQRSGD